MKYAIAAIVIAAPSLALAEPIDLVCRGVATTVETDTTQGYATDDDGDRVSATFNHMGKVRAPESIRVRVDPETNSGMIRPPSTMRPLMSKGHDGWWDFNTVAVTNDEIRAQYTFNFVNRPKVLIDRRTGTIEMRGIGGRFTGDCEKAPSEAERKF